MPYNGGFYCSDPWCDGDHALPSQTCASPSTDEDDTDPD